LSESAPQISPEAEAPCVMVVAGEHSGDAHAAEVVKQLGRMIPGVRVFGMGGSALRAAGMETIVDSETSASVMGLVEVGGRLHAIYGAYRRLAAEAGRRSPRLAILVDFPDFNLFLARALHRRGVRILYYISPQLWAWRRGRIRLIKRFVTKVVPIFPFEEEHYRRHDVASEYLGHPLLDRPADEYSRAEFLAARGLNPRAPVLALLPGSRKSEVSRLLKPMLVAAARRHASRPGLQVAIWMAAGLSAEWFRRQLPAGLTVALLEGEARQTLRAADAAVVASGTATLEAALAEVPFAVVYKLSPLTYVCARLLVRLPHFAMPNLVAGGKVVDELLQGEVTPERIADAVAPYLDEPAARAAFRERIGAVRRRLEVRDGRGTSAERTAALAAEMLGS